MIYLYVWTKKRSGVYFCKLGCLLLSLWTVKDYIDGLLQDSSIFIVNTIQILQSYGKTSMWIEQNSSISEAVLQSVP